MKIITLSPEKFDEFAKSHKYSNYYQTSDYANVMKSEGYDHHFLGFINNSNILIGATMFLYKKVFLKYKMAYAPYGFLIDYSDSDLIEELTSKLKKLLIKQNFIYVKINPMISCSERSQKGEIISYNPEINDTLEILQKNGYIHHGFNSFFEDMKPRWNAIVKLTESNENLYKDFNKQTRNKISKAIRNGIEIYKGENEDLAILYEFIKRKHNKSLKFYKSLLKEFKDNSEIYLAKLNLENYVKYSKDSYEKELEISEKWNNALQEASRKGIDITKIITKKMEADQKTSIYQAQLVEASKLFSQYPDGIVISGALIIKHQDTVNLIIEGFNSDFRKFNSNYLLKWGIIKKFNQEGFRTFNLNGIVGEFEENNKYSGLNEMKMGFHAVATEYIGEFDLVINKTVYNLYQKKLNKAK